MASFLLMSALPAAANAVPAAAPAEPAVSAAATVEPAAAVVPAPAEPAAVPATATAPVIESDPAPAPAAAATPAPLPAEEPARPVDSMPAAPPAAAADEAPVAGEDPRPAAERGQAAAQYQLGLKLRAEQQLDEARMWFERAAAQDHPAALHQLSQLYDKGQGVEADPHKGFELSLKAARLGWPEAMWDVATSYGAGRVGPRDLLSACTWILRAREHAGTDKPQVVEQARQVLPYLERALSLEQVAACRKQAAVWPPTSDTATPVAAAVIDPPARSARSSRRGGRQLALAKGGRRVAAARLSAKAKAPLKAKSAQRPRSGGKRSAAAARR